ncbi:MAG: hypothetical protein NZM65_02695 [Flavobacteriales bacterium]|nr:hypothetical protein [Flavobacteriales bacterium]MDW8409578.1 hypothetical protein [Flavobacteriales bacterium]
MISSSLQIPPRLFPVSSADRLRAALIAIASFILYAPPFSHQLNSDAAVHILMSLRWYGLESLYFWGQDRLGSLVPLLAFPFVQAGCDPVWTYSLVLWLMPALAWEALSPLARWPFARLLLAWILWIPYPTAVEYLLPGHPYAPQLALLGWSWRLALVAQGRSGFLLLSGFLTGMALWVSDFSVVFGGILALGWAYTLFAHKESRQRLLTQAFIWILGLIPPVLGIIVLKELHPYPVAYYGRWLGTWKGFLQGLEVLGKALGSLLREFRPNPYLTVFGGCTGLVVAFFVQGLLSKYPLKAEKTTSSTLLFSLSNATLGLLGLLASSWVQGSGFEARYFAYPLWWMGVALVFMTDVNGINPRGILMTLFLAIGFTAYGFRTAEREFVLSRLDARAFSLKQLREEAIPERGGIVASYWNSYIQALGRNPRLPLTAEETTARQPQLALETLQQDSVWVCGSNWLTQYPTYLVQFNRVLHSTDMIRSGTRFHWCLYKTLGHTEIKKLWHPVTWSVAPDRIDLAPYDTSSVYCFLAPTEQKGFECQLWIEFSKKGTNPPVNILLFENNHQKEPIISMPFFRFPNCQSDTCLFSVRLKTLKDTLYLAWSNYSSLTISFRILKTGLVWMPKI